MDNLRGLLNIRRVDNVESTGKKEVWSGEEGG